MAKENPSRKGMRGGSHKGDKQNKSFHDTEMEGKSNLTAEGAKKRGEAMTHNLSATERAKRKDDPKK